MSGILRLQSLPTYLRVSPMKLRGGQALRVSSHRLIQKIAIVVTKQPVCSGLVSNQGPSYLFIADIKLFYLYFSSLGNPYTTGNSLVH